MTEIYAETFLAVNFSADFLMILICARFLGRSVKYRNAFLSAMTGAVYALISIYICLDGIPGVICNLLSAILMCTICFGRLGYKTLIKSVFLLYISSCLLGGGLTAFSNVMSYASVRLGKALPLPVLLLLSGVICFVFTVIVKRITLETYKTKVKTEVYMFGRHYELSLLCDSGNVALDPYSGKHVIVVKAESIEKLLGNNLSILDDAFGNTDSARDLKIRYIPIKTAAGECVLKAFTAEKAYVCVDNKKTEIDVCFAIDSQTQNDYLGTDGVIPLSLVADLI